MATATIIQNSGVISHTPAGALTRGDIVVTVSRIGIAVRDIGAGSVGELCVEGVAAFPKATSGGSAIPDGTRLYYNASTHIVSITASDGLFIGAAAAVSVDADATQLVRLNASGVGTGTAVATVIAAVAGTLTGTVDGTIADIAATAASTAGTTTPSAAQVDAGIATAVASIVTGTNTQLKELQTTVNALIAALKVAGLMASS
jgi:predicted RecA/RadA family phage recombinase